MNHQDNLQQMEQQSVQCDFSFFTVSTLNFLLFVISLVVMASGTVGAVPAYCKLARLRNQSSCHFIHSVHIYMCMYKVPDSKGKVVC